MEQSADDDRPHLTKFFRVGRELLMQRTVKLNTFLERLD